MKSSENLRFRILILFDFKLSCISTHYFCHKIQILRKINYIKMMNNKLMPDDVIAKRALTLNSLYVVIKSPIHPTKFHDCIRNLIFTGTDGKK